MVCTKNPPFHRLETPPKYIYKTSELYRDRTDSGERSYSFLSIYRRRGGVVSRHGYKKSKKYILVIHKCQGPTQTLITNGNNSYIKDDMPATLTYPPSMTLIYRALKLLVP
jgi:hypothetical protein